MLLNTDDTASAVCVRGLSCVHVQDLLHDSLLWRFKGFWNTWTFVCIFLKVTECNLPVNVYVCFGLTYQQKVFINPNYAKKRGNKASRGKEKLLSGKLQVRVSPMEREPQRITVTTDTFGVGAHPIEMNGHSPALSYFICFPATVAECVISPSNLDTSRLAALRFPARGV